MTEASVWHEEKKAGGWTEYYLLLKDEGSTVSFILKYNAHKKEVRAEPYSPPDINYTIHDGCDHENDECFLDDPESSESEDVYMADKYRRSLDALERQIKQQKVADSIEEARLQEPALVSCPYCLGSHYKGQICPLHPR